MLDEELIFSSVLNLILELSEWEKSKWMMRFKFNNSELYAFTRNFIDCKLK